MTPSKPGKSSLEEYFPRVGPASLEGSQLSISGYPFEPSAAYNGAPIEAKSIEWACVKHRPYVKVGEEVVFLSAMERENLKQFVDRNQLPLVDHAWIWNFILEPFLDTEFSPESQQRSYDRLAERGLTRTEVDAIRKEVGPPMFAYNFGTMLWEWGDLDLYDCLCAMRVACSKEEFNDFYTRAMKIALLPKLKNL